jgi:hypothetical protein
VCSSQAIKEMGQFLRTCYASVTGNLLGTGNVRLTSTHLGQKLPQSLSNLGRYIPRHDSIDASGSQHASRIAVEVSQGKDWALRPQVFIQLGRNERIAYGSLKQQQTIGTQHFCECLTIRYVRSKQYDVLETVLPYKLTVVGFKVTVTQDNLQVRRRYFSGLAQAGQGSKEGVRVTSYRGKRATMDEAYRLLR